MQAQQLQATAFTGVRVAAPRRAGVKAVAPRRCVSQQLTSPQTHLGASATARPV